jgi:SSS family solute:Na+ symporter
MIIDQTQLFGVAIVIILTVLVSVYYSKKVKSNDEYVVGGRKQNTLLVAGGLLGTIIGGASTVGTAQLSFSVGYPAWWFTLGAGIAFFIMGLFYAKPLRKTNLTTIPEFLSKKVGKKIGLMSGIVAILGIFFSIVSSSLTAIHLITAIFNLGLYFSASIVIFLVLTIIFFGGIGSTSGVGILKAIIILATVCFGIVLTVISLGGYSVLKAQLNDAQLFTVFGLGHDYAAYKVGLMIIGIISTQTYVQSLFSAKNSRIAAKACFLAAILITIIGFAPVTIGMYIKTVNPNLVPVNALPFYLLNYLPKLMGGIGIGGIILSALGSIAGLTLGCSSMLSNDIIAEFYEFKTEQSLIRMTKFIIVLILLIAMVFVFYNFNSLILDWNFLSMGLRGIVFIPLTIAIFARTR